MFSSLHIVNLLGGSPVGAVMVQLGFTFVYGLLFAPLALKLNALWPLILIHGLWDFMMIGKGVLGIESALLSAVLPALMALMAAALWIDLWRSRAPR